MNETLEVFRRRLRSDVRKAPKEKAKIKDFLSLAISSLALVISATTAYVNLVWQSDDIRVVITTFAFYYDQESQVLELGEMPEWTFINSGNRSAAIRGLTMAVASTFTCSKAKEAESFRYEIEPFVIKPSEIIAKTLHIRPGANIQSSQVSPLLKAFVKVDKPSRFLLCVMAHIVTPDSVTFEAAVPLWEIYIPVSARDPTEFIAIYDVDK
jgi:hypothetical protein